jgi:hypothetical protein
VSGKGADSAIPISVKRPSDPVDIAIAAREPLKSIQATTVRMFANGDSYSNPHAKITDAPNNGYVVRLLFR